MRSCQEIAAVASQFVDGELSLMSWAEVRMHMWLCPPCRAYVHQISMTRDVLERLPTDEVPDDVKGELLGRFKVWVQQGAPCDEEPLD